VLDEHEVRGTVARNAHQRILLCSGALTTSELARLAARCAFQPLAAAEKVHGDAHRAILYVPAPSSSGWRA
jgi:hypothetical protein